MTLADVLLIGVVGFALLNCGAIIGLLISLRRPIEPAALGGQVDATSDRTHASLVERARRGRAA